MWKHFVKRFLESIIGSTDAQTAKQILPLMSKKMNLKLKRTQRSDKSTIGELTVDGLLECYTLEDVERKEKIYGKTAIPTGTYKVSITHSPRFNRRLPLLENVPGFEGVRIHPGNKAEDTEGCILVGRKKSQDMILESRLAFDALFKKLETAEEIQIEIS